jgi:two-component sensor histidine kinase
VRCKKDNPVPAIVVHREDGEVIGQWNLKGEWVERSKIHITDFDYDGFKEVVGFTWFNDSIWLHLIEPLQAGGTILHLPVERAELYNGTQDWSVHFADPADLTGDNRDEYCFSILAGFTIQPRRLFVYNVYKEELIAQEEKQGVNISSPVLVDMDDDGYPEITGRIAATGNVKDSLLSYSDSCSWLMIYDRNLLFKAPPLPYSGSPSYLNVMALKTEQQTSLVTAYFNRSKGETVNQVQQWELVDGSLNMVNSRKMDGQGEVRLLTADQSENGTFYMANEHEIIHLNHRLEELNRFPIDGPYVQSRSNSQDIDGDGVYEQIYFSDYRMLNIYRSNFSHVTKLDVGYHEEMPVVSSFSNGKEHLVNLFLYPENMLLRYSRNPLYPFRFLLFLLMFFAYYLLFSFVANLQRRRIESRQSLERQVMHYQLTNVMQQLDPHFMFNALTSISSYYHKGDTAHAQAYLSRMSKLMQSSLENSERMTISLREEIRFVRDYLTLENLRLGDLFSFNIDVEEVFMDQVQIPKMLIQNFAENALKHGILHLKDRKGLIRVYSLEQSGALHICVEDNGIGRKEASEISSNGNGKGLVITQRILEIFRQLKKVKISYEIVDLYVEEVAAGTRVTIKIPKDSM